MMEQKCVPTYPRESREREVQLLRANRADYSSATDASKPIASKHHVSSGCLRAWDQLAERNVGERSGLTSTTKDRIEKLRHEVIELREAHDILN